MFPNQQQLKAINSIEGPVMVIAGAGTGKTQTIALRIAKILEVTQTPPSSILCLTFTDSAATNMRQRLLAIIGPLAYQVRVHTFHSFCNDVIQNNSAYFILAKESKVIDQLEQIEIFQEIINQLPDGAALKPWGDKYYYLRDIITSIQILKRENITPNTFQNLIDNESYFQKESADIISQLKALRISQTLPVDLLKLVDQVFKIPNLSDSISTLISYHLHLYKNGGYDIGAAKNPAVNFKNALLKISENFSKNIPKQQELLDLYQKYQKIMSDRGRYDFDDMILFVLRAFTDNPNLLLEYQEKFQYILVDEYQDTNSAQNQIIDLLGSYYDLPNIFVVGDDDQSIFRFQGASTENLQHFISKYQTKPIVLTNNYRSHQLILDSAASLINQNKNRLGKLIKDIDKNLKSQQNFDPDPINLTVTDSPLAENYLLSQKIKSLINSGVPASEIAVLYRNNKDNVDLVEVLNQAQIPFYLPSDQDILKSKPIIHLINLLKLIQNPNDKTLIYPVLSSEFINFNPLDLLRYTRGKTLTQKSQKKLRRFEKRLAQARVWLEQYNLDKFFNKVIRRFRFLQYYLKTDNIGLINFLYTFYSELKRLCLEQNFTLAQFLGRLDLYAQNNLPLSAQPLVKDTTNSIQLMTAHKAKGLEFSHVFIIQCLDKKWGNNPDRSVIKLPPGIIKTELSTEITDDNEDERRLFYVALTRAKSQIYLSYSTKNNSGRDQLPSIFLSEINPKLIQKNTPPPDTQTNALKTLFSSIYHLPKNQSKLSEYLDHFLKTDYVFNVTHLNSYLRCPYCFYHNTILHLPKSKEKFSSFGTAIHAALSAAYSGQKNIIETFTHSLFHEQLPVLDYQESLSKGKIVLQDYLNYYPIDQRISHIVDYDFKANHVHFGNIPLTGKIDLIKILKGNQVEVIDFKTGNPDSKYKELSPDGDYFRQLVFYKLLSILDPNFKYEVARTTIDFVEKSKQKNTFIRKEFEIDSNHVEGLKNLITNIYDKILSQDFFHIGENCKNKSNLHYLLDKS